METGEICDNTVERGALQEEENQTPLRNRTQHACLLIGAGGTGKTTIILELMLDVFCHFFPARPGEEERYMISTFSDSQSDAISNFQRFLSGTNMPYCLLLSCGQSAQQAPCLENKRARDETTLGAKNFAYSR